MVEFTFDRQKFMQNLQAAMEQAGLKANELEQKAGVYAGYISRLKGEDTKLPGLDVIWKMAKVLGVSLGRLIEGTFERSTENLAYLERFIRELFRRTVEKELDWKPVHLSEVDAILEGKPMPSEKAGPFLEFDAFGGYGEKLGNGHKDTPFDGSAIQCGQWKVHSFELPSDNVWLNGPVFYTDFGENKTLYLSRVCGPALPFDVIDEDYADDTEGIGRWFEFIVKDNDSSGNESVMLCATYGQGFQLAHAGRELYEELCKHEWDYRIEDNVRYLIDGFMSRGQSQAAAVEVPSADTIPEVDTDELPF